MTRLLEETNVNEVPIETFRVGREERTDRAPDSHAGPRLPKIAGRTQRPVVRLVQFTEAVWRLLFPRTEDYLVFFAIETNEGKRAAIAAALENACRSWASTETVTPKGSRRYGVHGVHGWKCNGELCGDRWCDWSSVVLQVQRQGRRRQGNGCVSWQRRLAAADASAAGEEEERGCSSDFSTSGSGSDGRRSSEPSDGDGLMQLAEAAVLLLRGGEGGGGGEGAGEGSDSELDDSELVEDAVVCYNGEELFLGSFRTKEEADVAVDEAAFFLFGR